MSSIDFTDQVVLVTGAGRGLGAAYARMLAERGAHVMVHDAGVGADGSGEDDGPAREVAEQIVAAGGSAEPLLGNLLDDGVCEGLVEQTVARHGRLDALIHNAGVVLWEDHEHPSDEIWEQTMGVNATAGFRLVRAAMKPMRERGYGRVVLTTSGRALRVEDGPPGLVAYSAAKMAVLGLIVGFKADVTDLDIHLNAVSPVAATRMLVRDAPHLTAESAAPAAVLLASNAIARSGLVLHAGGGTFGTEQWQAGPDLEAATPEELRDLL